MDEQSPVEGARKFTGEHDIIKVLACGGEGKVSLWKNKASGRMIAVKEPVKDHPMIRAALKKEIKSMAKLGQHPHIVHFLGSADDWQHFSPAIFYEFCELGDVQDFTYTLLRSDSWIPELTIWKFLMDMTKGLDHLHNGLDVTYVHGDLKPNNILVSRPPGDYTGIPLLPTFKLADISHLTPYDRKGRSAYNMFAGTWEYGPPIEERKKRVAPSVDIWAIGASLQTLAWGILPVKSNATIKQDLIAAGCSATDESVRQLRSNDDYRRTQLPFVWRPLNASTKDQLTKYDMEHIFPPYSDPLNDWYTMCVRRDPKLRVTSQVLKEHFLPLAEQQLELLVAKKRRDDALEKVRSIKAKIDNRRKNAVSRTAPAEIKEPPVARPIPRKPIPGKKDLAQANAKGKKKAELADGKGKKKFSRF
jgi:serine/threonine protein kinase